MLTVLVCSVPFIGFSSPGISSIVAPELSTDGGDEVLIIGQGFGPSDNTNLLNSVTYRPSGYGYTASCIVVTLRQIRCLTVAEFGSDLKWTVTVGGQSSDVSTSVTNYATVSVFAIIPVGVLSDGGTFITITGPHFALSASDITAFVLWAEVETKLVIAEKHPGFDADTREFVHLVKVIIPAGSASIPARVRLQSGDDRVVVDISYQGADPYPSLSITGTSFGTNAVVYARCVLSSLTVFSSTPPLALSLSTSSTPRGRTICLATSSNPLPLFYLSLVSSHTFNLSSIPGS